MTPDEAKEKIVAKVLSIKDGWKSAEVSRAICHHDLPGCFLAELSGVAEIYLPSGYVITDRRLNDHYHCIDESIREKEQQLKEQEMIEIAQSL